MAFHRYKAASIIKILLMVEETGTVKQKFYINKINHLHVGIAI